MVNAGKYFYLEELFFLSKVDLAIESPRRSVKQIP